MKLRDSSGADWFSRIRAGIAAWLLRGGSGAGHPDFRGFLVTRSNPQAASGIEVENKQSDAVSAKPIMLDLLLHFRRILVAGASGKTDQPAFAMIELRFTFRVAASHRNRSPILDVN